MPRAVLSRGGGGARAVRAARTAALAAWAALALAPVPGAAQTLPELWQAALARDPGVAVAAAQARAAEERVVQAGAAFGPTLALTGNYGDTRLREAPADETRPFWARQASLQLNQPLLRPALLPGLKGARAQAEQALALLAQARQDLAQRVAEACFDLLRARDTVLQLRAQRAFTAEQLGAAQRRYRIGSAPVTDLREAEARADLVAAQLAAAEHELQLRQQLLEELAGMQPQVLLRRGLAEDQLPALPPGTLAQWVDEAQASSPRVQQAQRALEVAEAEVSRARAAHAPTLDLTASQTLSKDTGTLTTAQARRYEATQVGVNLNLPLFASGAIQSRVREALAQQDRAAGELEGARRAVAVEVRQQFSAAQSALAQARGYATAVKSADVALRASRRGWETGLRVLGDALDAQSRLFDAQREFTRARYDAWLGQLRLQALAGRLGAEDFGQMEARLGPVADELPLPARPRTEERGR